MDNTPFQSPFNPQPQPDDPLRHRPIPPAPQPGYEQQWQAYRAMQAAQNQPATQSSVPQPVSPTQSWVVQSAQPVQQPAAAPQPYEQPAFVPAVTYPQAGLPPQKPRRRKAPFVVLGTTLAVLIAGTATYVFAFYIPNRPENVWASGLGNTGQALTQLTTELTSSNSLNRLSTYSLDGTFNATSKANADTGTGETTISGSLSAHANSKTADADLKGTVKSGSNAETLELKTIASQAPNSTYPDTYFKVIGLKAIGADELFPGIEQYDGKWIAVPSSYLEQTLGVQDTDSAAISKQDVAALTQAVTKVVTQDVLTSKPSDSLFVRQTFVGHETKNGRDSYHYTGTINQDRAQTFCTDLAAAVTASAVYKKLGADASSGKDSADCLSSLKKAFPASKPFDLWIDSGYRVLSALRQPDPDKAGAWDEVGEIVSDLNSPTVYLTSDDNAGNVGTIKVAVNKTTLAATCTVDYTGSDTSYSIKANVAPYSGTIQATPPTGSTDIRTVINQFGLGADTPMQDAVQTF